MSASSRLGVDTKCAWVAYTELEVADMDYFPEQKADLYLSRSEPSEEKPNNYLLYYLDNAQFFVVKKLIKVIVGHEETGDWEAESGSDYPCLIFVCDNSRMEERITDYIDSLADSSDAVLRFITTSLSSFAV